AGGVAHDVNNILTVILCSCEILLEEALPISAREHITTINRTGSRMAEMIRQLLAFSRQQVLRPKVTDLNQVVTEAGKLLPQLLLEKRIELVAALAPDLRPTLIDPVQMERTIINLAVNARDAMPEGGKLVVATANLELREPDPLLCPKLKPGTYVVLSVSDTG